MARIIHRLNALAVSRASKRGYYPDGAGLYLQVSGAGTKSWVFRYASGGRTRDMGLGSLADFSLAEARERARRARQQRSDGVDPLAARHAATASVKLSEAKVATFKEVAERYMAAHEAGWKNERHKDQWHSTLENYAYPIIGDHSVAAIDTALIMRVLEQVVPDEGATLWIARTETASRLRGRIETILDSATARGHRTGENPARWKGHLDKLLTNRRQRGHHPALPYFDLPAFMAALSGRPGSSARALELAILTGLRTNEVLGGRRTESKARELGLIDSEGGHD